MIIVKTEALAYFLLQSTTFLEPAELFKNEIEESIRKVHVAIKILRRFKECFFEHRDKIASYFKGGEEPKLWEFTPKLVFCRFDVYLERVETMTVHTNRKHKDYAT